MSVKWKRLSDYAIQSGDYTISKALVKESPRYALYQGDQMIAVRDSAEELKKMAEEKEIEHAE